MRKGPLRRNVNTETAAIGELGMEKPEPYNPTRSKVVILRKTRSLHDGDRIEDNNRRRTSGISDVDRQLLVGAKELARMMDVSTRTLWRLLSAGKLIQPVRIGGNTRWRLGEVRRWIADGCPPPARRHE